MTHGTWATYNRYRCKCPPCKAEGRRYGRARWARSHPTARGAFPTTAIGPYLAPMLERDGLPALQERYAARYGLTSEAAGRELVAEAVDVDGADRLALFAGLHPVLVWPEAYRAAA